MGFLDNAKKSLTKVVDRHGATIEKGADKLGDAINQRTGNKHADTVAKGREQLRKGLHDLDRKDAGGGAAAEPRADGLQTPPVDRGDDRLR